MKEIIGAGVLFAVSLLLFLLSIRSFRGNGFLLNNAYLYASRQERETMDKKPYYRQTAIVFLLIGLVFLLNGFAVLTHAGWILPVVIAVILVTIVYAIVSSIAIEKKKTQK